MATAAFFDILIDKDSFAKLSENREKNRRTTSLPMLIVGSFISAGLGAKTNFSGAVLVSVVIKPVVAEPAITQGVGREWIERTLQTSSVARTRFDAAGTMRKTPEQSLLLQHYLQNFEFSKDLKQCWVTALLLSLVSGFVNGLGS